jgi:uncharacterized protein YqjF (DUF2071 family)
MRTKTPLQPTDLDRLAIRERPQGSPIMHQTWGKLLFMHWPMPEATLRPLIPDRLTIDTFNGTAWIAITPFTMWDVRPFSAPRLPWLSSFHELNVRTYVHLDGVPGVWFLSLDINSAVAVLAAREFFHLPYFNATIDLKQEAFEIDYSLRRAKGESPEAAFEASWTMADFLPYPHPGSLEFFLTERYCFYCTHKQQLYRCRVFHPPWPLQEARLQSYASTMIQSHDLPAPGGEPLVHYSEAVKVDIWPLAEV